MTGRIEVDPEALTSASIRIRIETGGLTFPASAPEVTCQSPVLSDFIGVWSQLHSTMERIRAQFERDAELIGQVATEYWQADRSAGEVFSSQTVAPGRAKAV